MYDNMSSFLCYNGALNSWILHFILLLLGPVPDTIFCFMTLFYLSTSQVVWMGLWLYGLGLFVWNKIFLIGLQMAQTNYHNIKIYPEGFQEVLLDKVYFTFLFLFGQWGLQLLAKSCGTWTLVRSSSKCQTLNFRISRFVFESRI